MKKCKALLCLSSLLFAAPTLAVTNSLYGQIGGGISDVKWNDENIAVANLAIGRQTSTYFAWELGGYFFESVTRTKKMEGGLKFKDEGSANIIALAAKGILPINDRLSLFAKLGLGGINESVEYKTYVNGTLTASQKVESTRAVGLASFGASAFLTDRVSLDATVTAFSANGDVEEKYLGIGSITFHF